MSADPANTPPENEERASIARAGMVVRGFRGFAIAVGGSLLVIVALWLAANDAPSASGEPFRFTPPPEPSVTAVVAGEGLGERPVVR